MRQGEFCLYKGKLSLIIDHTKGRHESVIQDARGRNSEVPSKDIGPIGPAEFSNLCKVKRGQLEARISEMEKAVLDVEKSSASDKVITEAVTMLNMDDDISEEDVRKFLTDKNPSSNVITSYINEYEIFSKKLV